MPTAHKIHPLQSKVPPCGAPCFACAPVGGEKRERVSTGKTATNRRGGAEHKSKQYRSIAQSPCKKQFFLQGRACAFIVTLAKINFFCTGAFFVWGGAVNPFFGRGVTPATKYIIYRLFVAGSNIKNFKGDPQKLPRIHLNISAEKRHLFLFSAEMKPSAPTPKADGHRPSAFALPFPPALFGLRKGAKRGSAQRRLPILTGGNNNRPLLQTLSRAPIGVHLDP